MPERTPRDVLADRIAKWAGEFKVYDYADRLLNDLDVAGYEVMPSICLTEGCTKELGAYCDTHGYVMHGFGRVGMEKDPERPFPQLNNGDGRAS